MCIQILTKEIIPRHKYSSYTETNLIEQARQNPDQTLMKISIMYHGRFALCHVLIESRLFNEPPEYVHNKIKKIMLEWAKKHFDQHEEINFEDKKHIVH